MQKGRKAICKIRVSFDGGLGAEAKEYRPISGHRLFPHFFLPRYLLDDVRSRMDTIGNFE